MLLYSGSVDFNWVFVFKVKNTKSLDIKANSKTTMINIAALGLYMLLTTASGNPAALPAPEVVNSNTPVTSGLKEETPEEISRNVDVEAYVREYFSDIPIMAKVVKCESDNRQFGKNGKVLRGAVVAADVGAAQINEDYHLGRARGMNIDIYTLVGNLEYARFLYEEGGDHGEGLGTRPWLASFECWSKFDQLALNKNQSGSFTN